MEIRRSWWLAALSLVGAEATRYWSDAPYTFRVLVIALGPLLVVDGGTALWAQTLARRTARGPRVFVPEEHDTWMRAGARFAMTLVLIGVGAVVDRVAGLGYSVTLWMALWGAGGHIRAVVRRMHEMAGHWGIERPVFPEEHLGSLDPARLTIGRRAEDDDGA